MAAVLLALAGLPATAQIPDTALNIPDGAVLSGTVDLAGQDLRLAAGSTAYVADDLILNVRSLDLAGDLVAAGFDADGNGPSITIVAEQSLTIAGGIVAGNGLDQADAHAIEGLDGGNGGSILLQAPTITVRETAQLAPGSGGRGGNVEYHAAPAGRIVRAGDGGDAGMLIFDGSPALPPGGGVMRPADGGVGGTASALESAEEVLAIGGSGGDGALFATTDLLVQSVMGYTMFRTVEPVSLCGDRQVCPKALLQRDCESDGGEPQFSVAIVVDPCAIHLCSPRDAECGPCSDCPPPPPPCEPILACLPCDGAGCVDRLCDFTACEVPTCGNDERCWLELVGIEDEQTGCGNGADGAPATNTGSPGGHGGPGAPGTAGNPTGGPGGTGGGGNPGGDGGATGGDGGDGRCWFSNGGDGGDGTGIGGKGGDGGQGGQGGAGTVFGGPGGTGGVCGAGGAGTGVGGQGGRGGTFGSPGQPGIGYSHPGLPGRGGPGGQGGAGAIPGPSGAGGTCGGVI